MADETKKVEYRFTGDVSSLKTATEGAIKLLDQYQSKITALTKSDAYTANQRVAKSMQTAISGTMREIERLQKKFQDVQNIKIFQGSPEANQLTSAMRNLQSQLDGFNGKSKVSTQDVKNLTAAMREAKQSFKDMGPAVDSAVNKEKRFQETLASIRQKSSDMAQHMRSAFGRLSQPFDGLGSKLEAFKAKASEAMDHFTRIFGAAGSGFQKILGSGDAEDASGLGNLVGALKNAASGMLKVNSASKSKTEGLEEETKQTLEDILSTNKFVIALRVLVTVVRTVVTAVKKAIDIFVALKAKLSGLTSMSDKVADSLRSIAQFISGLKLGELFGEATKEAMSYIENLNLFMVAMGESVDEALKFVDAMSEVYGMDPSNLYRYAGYFNQLTDAIGMSTKASKTISLSLTKASNDIASLFNVEIEQVVENLASGMQGMSRAVRKYGIDIRQSTLAQTALNYGFQENISTTSEANRQALRYLTIMQQVKNATKQVTSGVDGSAKVMGDFARNIETPANQLRILKEQASQVARAFGNFFIPVMQKVLYVINGVLMALRILLEFLAALAGIDIKSFGGEVSQGAEDAAGAVSGIGDAADSTAKKLKKLIAPFDELTILSKNQDADKGGGLGGIGTDALDPGLAAAIEAMSLGLDEVRMKAMDVRDKILELLGLEFDGSEITVTIGGFIDDLIHLWDSADYTGFGERVAEFLNQGIAWGIQHTDPTVYAPQLNQKVATLAQVLNGLVKGFDWSGLGTIIGNGITLALGALNTFLTTFDFTQLGASLGNGLNGIVTSVNWDLLGQTLGNLFMAKIRLLTGFFETFDWPTLGTGLATGLMSLVDTVQWDEIGAKVAARWNGIIEGVRAFWATYEWGTLGSSLAEYFSTAIQEINWHNMGAAASETLRGLFRDITNFLGELDWFSIGKAICEFVLAIDWLGLLEDVVVAVITILGAVVRGLLGMIVGIFTGIGKDIAEGFQNGILDGLKNIGKWLWDHLADPVIRAVKGFFGIHSPSTVFKEIGDNIIQGMLDGISNALRSIATWLKSKIVDPVINTVKRGFGIVGSASSVFRNLGNNVVTGLMGGLQTVGSKLSSWGTSLKSTVQGIFDNVSSTVSGAISGIKNAVSNIATTVSNKMQSVTSSVNNAANKTAETASKAGASKPVTTARNTARMATGGVVKRPTNALIGEGRYDEAVIPLGNSPELQEMIDKIATAVSATPRDSRDSDRPIEVHVYIDGEEITTRQNRTNRMYGRTQQRL